MSCMTRISKINIVAFQFFEFNKDYEDKFVKNKPSTINKHHNNYFEIILEIIS